MVDLKHILIPVDFSLPVLAAAADARKLADQPGTRISLLHVRHSRAGGAATVPASKEDWIAGATGGDALSVAQGLESILAGLSLEHRCLWAIPLKRSSIMPAMPA